jgi:AcrR family transcriptional regulator
MTEGPRARYREQTRGEIKDVALRQLADGGVSAIALTRVAKELGLSGPALYRYFSSRDDLLSALIRDAYDDIAAVIGAAAENATKRSRRQRLRSLGEAYRGWATGQPHRYLLIAGSPLPGYSAPPDTALRARAALGPFLPVFARAEPSPAVLPVVRQMDAWAREDPQVAEWVTQYLTGPGGGDQTGDQAGDETGRALAGAVLAWTRMHGVVSLEVDGQFTGMGLEPRALLEAEVEALADTFHLD